MYLPFYVGFDSQAGGILPNFMYPTRGVHLWVMWGTLFIPLFAYLIYLWQNKTSANWRAGILTSLGIVALLLAAIFIVGLIALKLKPDLILPVIQSQGRSVGTFIADSMLRRLKYIGSLLTLLALLIPALSFLFKSENSPSSFILLMVGLASLLIIGPDFLYLRDNFGYRINTVFKFYYQAWILLSLAVAFAVAVMGSQLRGWHSTLYTVVMILVIGAGLVYPVFSLPSKTDDFKVQHPEQRTLNGEAYLVNSMPDDYQAIQFMQQLTGRGGRGSGRTVFRVCPHFHLQRSSCRVRLARNMKDNGAIRLCKVHERTISKRCIQLQIGSLHRRSSIVITSVILWLAISNVQRIR